jgi:hypothetical protein
MPLDPSIILGARPAQFDMAQFSPMNAMTGVMKFKQLDQENRINALKMQEYERARTEEEGLRNYLAEADFAKREQICCAMAKQVRRRPRLCLSKTPQL